MAARRGCRCCWCCRHGVRQVARHGLGVCRHCMRPARHSGGCGASGAGAGRGSGEVGPGAYGHVRGRSGRGAPREWCGMCASILEVGMLCIARCTSIYVLMGARVTRVRYGLGVRTGRSHRPSRGSSPRIGVQTLTLFLLLQLPAPYCYTHEHSRCHHTRPACGAFRPRTQVPRNQEKGAQAGGSQGRRAGAHSSTGSMRRHTGRVFSNPNATTG